MNSGKLRQLETEEMQRLRAQRLESRKRAARRVLEDGGCWADAARASAASPETVKRWAQDGGWRVSA